MNFLRKSGEIYGKTKKDTHFKVLPLCFEHHRRGGDKEPISRHPYKARFVAAYGTEEQLLAEVNDQIQYLKDEPLVDWDEIPF